jgi:hypothetical protein
LHRPSGRILFIGRAEPARQSLCYPQQTPMRLKANVVLLAGCGLLLLIEKPLDSAVLESPLHVLWRGQSHSHCGIGWATRQCFLSHQPVPCRNPTRWKTDLIEGRNRLAENRGQHSGRCAVRGAVGIPRRSLGPIRLTIKRQRWCYRMRRRSVSADLRCKPRN